MKVEQTNGLRKIAGRHYQHVLFVLELVELG